MACGIACCSQDQGGQVVESVFSDELAETPQRGLGESIFGLSASAAPATTTTSADVKAADEVTTPASIQVAVDDGRAMQDAAPDKEANQSLVHATHASLGDDGRKADDAQGDAPEQDAAQLEKENQGVADAPVDPRPSRTSFARRFSTVKMKPLSWVSWVPWSLILQGPGNAIFVFVYLWSHSPWQSSCGDPQKEDFWFWVFVPAQLWGIGWSLATVELLFMLAHNVGFWKTMRVHAAISGIMFTNFTLAFYLVHMHFGIQDGLTGAVFGNIGIIGVAGAALPVMIIVQLVMCAPPNATRKDYLNMLRYCTFTPIVISNYWVVGWFTCDAVSVVFSLLKDEVFLPLDKEFENKDRAQQTLWFLLRFAMELCYVALFSSVILPGLRKLGGWILRLGMGVPDPEVVSSRVSLGPQVFAKKEPRSWYGRKMLWLRRFFDPTGTPFEEGQQERVELGNFFLDILLDTFRAVYGRVIFSKLSVVGFIVIVGKDVTGSILQYGWRYMQAHHIIAAMVNPNSKLKPKVETYKLPRLLQIFEMFTRWYMSMAGATGGFISTYWVIGAADGNFHSVQPYSGSIKEPGPFTTTLRCANELFYINLPELAEQQELKRSYQKTTEFIEVDVGERRPNFHQVSAQIQACMHRRFSVRAATKMLSSWALLAQVLTFMLFKSDNMMLVYRAQSQEERIYVPEVITKDHLELIVFPCLLVIIDIVEYVIVSNIQRLNSIDGEACKSSLAKLWGNPHLWRLAMFTMQHLGADPYNMQQSRSFC